MDLVTIDLDVERETVKRLWEKWQKAAAAKRAAIEEAVTSHTHLGNNYWLPEHEARARYVIAANFVDMLEAARSAQGVAPSSAGPLP